MKVIPRIIASLLVVISPILLSFVVEWGRHTARVQEVSTQDIEKLKSADVYWISMDFSIPVDARDIIRTIHQSSLVGFVSYHNAYKDEFFAYRAEMHNLIFMLINDSRDIAKLREQRDIIVQAQQKLYAAADKFNYNILYAMWYTL